MDQRDDLSSGAVDDAKNKCEPFDDKVQKTFYVKQLLYPWKVSSTKSGIVESKPSIQPSGLKKLKKRVPSVLKHAHGGNQEEDKRGQPAWKTNSRNDQTDKTVESKPSIQPSGLKKFRKERESLVFKQSHKKSRDDGYDVIEGGEVAGHDGQGGPTVVDPSECLQRGSKAIVRADNERSTLALALKGDVEYTPSIQPSGLRKLGKVPRGFKDSQKSNNEEDTMVIDPQAAVKPAGGGLEEVSNTSVDGEEAPPPAFPAKIQVETNFSIRPSGLKKLGKIPRVFKRSQKSPASEVKAVETSRSLKVAQNEVLTKPSVEAPLEPFSGRDETIVEDTASAAAGHSRGKPSNSKATIASQQSEKKQEDLGEATKQGGVAADPLLSGESDSGRNQGAATPDEPKPSAVSKTTVDKLEGVDGRDQTDNLKSPSKNELINHSEQEVPKEGNSVALGVSEGSNKVSRDGQQGPTVVYTGTVPAKAARAVDEKEDKRETEAGSSERIQSGLPQYVEIDWGKSRQTQVPQYVEIPQKNLNQSSEPIHIHSKRPTLLAIFQENKKPFTEDRETSDSGDEEDSISVSDPELYHKLKEAAWAQCHSSTSDAAVVAAEGYHKLKEVAWAQCHTSMNNVTVAAVVGYNKLKDVAEGQRCGSTGTATLPETVHVFCNQEESTSAEADQAAMKDLESKEIVEEVNKSKERHPSSIAKALEGLTNFLMEQSCCPNWSQATDPSEHSRQKMVEETDSSQHRYRQEMVEATDSSEQRYRQKMVEATDSSEQRYHQMIVEARSGTDTKEKRVTHIDHTGIDANPTKKPQKMEWAESRPSEHEQNEIVYEPASTTLPLPTEKLIKGEKLVSGGCHEENVPEALSSSGDEPVRAAEHQPLDDIPRKVEDVDTRSRDSQNEMAKEGGAESSSATELARAEPTQAENREEVDHEQTSPTADHHDQEGTDNATSGVSNDGVEPDQATDPMPPENLQKVEGEDMVHRESQEAVAVAGKGGKNSGLNSEKEDLSGKLQKLETRDVCPPKAVSNPPEKLQKVEDKNACPPRAGSKAPKKIQKVENKDACPKKRPSGSESTKANHNPPKNLLKAEDEKAGDSSKGLVSCAGSSSGAAPVVAADSTSLENHQNIKEKELSGDSNKGLTSGAAGSSGDASVMARQTTPPSQTSPQQVENKNMIPSGERNEGSAICASSSNHDGVQPVLATDFEGSAIGASSSNNDGVQPVIATDLIPAESEGSAIGAGSSNHNEVQPGMVTDLIPPENCQMAEKEGTRSGANSPEGLSVEAASVSEHEAAGTKPTLGSACVSATRSQEGIEIEYGHSPVELSKRDQMEPQELMQGDYYHDTSAILVGSAGLPDSDERRQDLPDVKHGQTQEMASSYAPATRDKEEENQGKRKKWRKVKVPKLFKKRSQKKKRKKAKKTQEEELVTSTSRDLMDITHKKLKHATTKSFDPTNQTEVVAKTQNKEAQRDSARMSQQHPALTDPEEVLLRGLEVPMAVPGEQELVPIATANSEDRAVRDAKDDVVEVAEIVEDSPDDGPDATSREAEPKRRVGFVEESPPDYVEHSLANIDGILRGMLSRQTNELGQAMNDIAYFSCRRETTDDEAAPRNRKRRSRRRVSSILKLSGCDGGDEDSEGTEEEVMDYDSVEGEWVPVNSKTIPERPWLSLW